jgi:hypothetical protein
MIPPHTILKIDIADKLTRPHITAAHSIASEFPRDK